MRKHLIAALMLVPATPALAQFPPPGIYACAEAGGAPVGELTLLVAGDYALKGPDGRSGSGQLASAGTDINPLSGPLSEMQVTGTFYDDAGRTVLQFNAPEGLTVVCR